MVVNSAFLSTAFLQSTTLAISETEESLLKRGYQTKVKVQFCNCEPDFLRLLRFGLLGATPTKPELAFTLDLMKLLHILNLECQVAVKDFCSALQILTDDVIVFSMVKRLSKQISQATKAMGTALNEFNRLECNSDWPLPRSLEVDDVKYPETELWLRSEFMGSTSPVPYSVKRKAIDLYNLVDRAKEGIDLLQSDMKNVIAHFTGEHAVFSSSLAGSSSISTEVKGRDVYIKVKLLSLESQLLELKTLFLSHIHEIALPKFVFQTADIPLKNNFEREEDDGTFLSLPESVDDSDSESDVDTEYETEVTNDA